MLVDYNVASLMLPMIIVGASIGVMLNKMFPSVVIAGALTLLLIFVIYKTFRKLCSIVSDERKTHGPLCGNK